MTEQTVITEQKNDEIDLIAIFKSLFKQRGLIIAFALAFLLLGAAFQLSKLAFYAPKMVSYPVAIDFISAGDDNYPNGTRFSPEDIISPENIRGALEASNLDLKFKEMANAVSVNATNSLIASTQQSLLSQLSNKKIPSEQVDAVKAALALLKKEAKTYVTVSLDLSKVKLSDKEVKKFLKMVVATWAENALKKGLINPNIAYPQETFHADKNAVIIDNYDKLLNYSRDLQTALIHLSQLKGSDTIAVDGQNINDLIRNISDIIDNDIYVMRSYAYSVSSALVEVNPLLEVQIASQLRVKDLEKIEIEKQIKVYDFILERLTNSSEADNTNSQVSTVRQSVEAKVDQGFLNELLRLGSQLSSSELKSEIINKRIVAAERLFKLEKEIATIKGSNGDADSSNNQQKIIASMPTLFETTVVKVNRLQKVFISLLEKYKYLTLNKHHSLYSTVSEPDVSNSFGFPLKKSLIILFAATLMGLFIGMALALLRSGFSSGKDT